MRGMSSGEIERRVLAGRVFTDGVAQETTREDGGVRVRLACMPGHPAYGAYGGKIVFPEPVTVGAGEFIVVEIEGLGDGGGDARVSACMPSPATITDAVAYGCAPAPMPQQRPWPRASPPPSLAQPSAPGQSPRRP